jgi:hypothetical protein
MSTSTDTTPRALITSRPVGVRPIALAIVAVLVAALLVLALVLALSGGSGREQTSSSNPAQTRPGALIPPSPVERHQRPGLNGPGMRP